MSDDTDIISDFGPAPAPLPVSCSHEQLISVVNELRHSAYEARAMRHKHRTHLNRVVDEVRSDMFDANKELAARLDAFGESQKRIERGLFGDEFGQKGMVHRLESIEQRGQSQTPIQPTPAIDENTFGNKVKTAATEWAVKLLIIVGILILYDYGSKAIELWKSGVA